MQITIKSRNLDVTEQLRTYIEKKVNRLDRFLPNIAEATVDLSTQHAKSAQDRQIAQITLRSTGGTYFRAEERSADLTRSIDAALDKMSRQVKRFKGKHWHSKGRHQVARVEAPEIVEEDEESQVVRVKRFEARPMDVDEAIEQMELLGHDFFIFFDPSEDGFSVIYRRRDGGYGLLIPELI